MRTIIAILFVIAAIAAIYERSHRGSDNFMTLEGKQNDQLIMVRQQCGNLKQVKDLLNERIGNDDGEEAAISYEELVVDVVDSLANDGIIPNNCVVSEPTGLVIVLLSTDGDVFVGLNGRAITTWSEAKAAEARGWKQTLATQEGRS